MTFTRLYNIRCLLNYCTVLNEVKMSAFIFSYVLFHVQDNEVFVYKVGEPHTHLEGYPKPLKDVLGIEGPVDAAFVCADHHIAHVVKGISIGMLVL